jgi:phosphatidylglycerophosphatase A
MNVTCLAFLGWPEIIAILVIVVLVFASRNLPNLARGLGEGISRFKDESDGILNDLDDSAHGAGRSAGGAFGRPVAEAITHWNQTAEDTSRPAFRADLPLKESMDKFIVWLAQGFGIGRIPVAPGTWGSLLGLGWFLLLTLIGWWPDILVCATLSALAAVYVCGKAEESMQQRDPPSVVLDEIVAVPFCFVFMLIIRLIAASEPNPLRKLFFNSEFFFMATVIALFRLFDIWKPWPIRQSQRLPGGWGVVMDDVLAAVYVNLVMLAAWGVMRWVG